MRNATYFIALFLSLSCFAQNNSIKRRGPQKPSAVLMQENIVRSVTTPKDLVARCQENLLGRKLYLLTAKNQSALSALQNEIRITDLDFESVNEDNLTLMLVIDSSRDLLEVDVIDFFGAHLASRPKMITSLPSETSDSLSETTSSEDLVEEAEVVLALTSYILHIKHKDTNGKKISLQAVVNKLRESGQFVDLDAMYNLNLIGVNSSLSLEAIKQRYPEYIEKITYNFKGTFIKKTK